MAELRIEPALRDSQGAVERAGKLGLLFRTFHCSGFFTALAYLVVACRFSAARLTETAGSAFDSTVLQVRR
jgi:hypothetical protein